MDELTLKLPVAIGGRVWDIDFPERPHLVTGYRIGRMMGEDVDDFEEDYEGRENELHIQYECGGMSCSMSVSSIGQEIFLTRDEAMKTASKNNHLKEIQNGEILHSNTRKFSL